MKKSIKNKIYDTETAKKIGEYKPQFLDVDNLGYYVESLYQKRTGEFFLHGTGDSDSLYKKRNDKSIDL